MLNPLFLWFLPLALVPIALHLITLYRLRTLELPTYRFLMDSYIQQRRKIKLLEFLLMLLRTAFVALIVFLLARPVLQKFNFLGGQSGRDVAIVIDAGAPMGLRTGGSTSLERAQTVARKIVELLAKDDHVALIRAGEKPEVLLNRFASQPAAIDQEIGKIKVGASPSNIAAALEDIFNTTPRGTRIVYVLTDGNKRGWSGLRGHPVTRLAGTDNQLVVMNVGPTEPVVNLAAVGDPPRALNTIAGLPVMLSATVVNTSKDRPKDTTLSVMLDDQQVTQMNLSLQPGQRITRAVTLTPSKPGLLRGKFQLPADAFPDDDAYLFALNVAPKLNVLVVAPPPATPGAPESADLFLRTALSAPLAAEWGDQTPVDTKKIASSLEVTAIPPASLTDALIANADVIMLSNVPLDATWGPKLRKFVETGGGLFIFPGPAVVPAPYNTYIFGSPATPTPNGLPGWNLPGFTLESPVGNVDDEAGFLPVTGIDLSHPIFSAFNEQGSEYFGTVRIYRHFPIKLPLGGHPGAGRSSVLMRLPDRTPMLVESRLGEGHLLVAGFSATPDWSNLPLKPEFVPILLRGVAYARRAPNVEATAAVKPNEPATIRITDRWNDAQVEATDPTGKPTAIALHRDGTKLVGGMIETGRKGFYNFRVTPRAASGSGVPDRIDMGFAVNLDISGADFDALSEAQMRQTLEPMKITYLRGSSNDPVLASQLTQKREIWRTLIWVMFAVIGVEFLLATLRPSGPAVTRGPGRPAGFRERLVQRINRLLAGASTEGD